ncbi:MAG: acyltransferase family protein [Bradyrhizobium sp.]|uniref:acyltransferase family protein n=1 Tax=Bradyrhizobium sp. TaxID=376 RepID=UPI002A326046|nr:acyltransferase [Bradyrhizobium sp.]
MLALAVASGHASGFFGAYIYPKVPGSHAVQLFYMISGFLIALILSGKYADTPQGNWIFYSNRAVKIYLPYLAILVVTVVIWLTAYAATGNAGPLQIFISEGRTMSLGAWSFAVITNLFLLGMEWGSMLIVRGGDLLLSFRAIEEPPNAIQFTVIIPAWTLSLELAFYLIAPFILRRHVLLIAALALASYTFRFQAYAHGYRSIATEYRFFPFELSLFLYGALSYRLYVLLKGRDMFRPALSLSITIACALTAISLPKYFSQHQHQMYALVGLLLPALFDFSTRHRWDKWLGDLSYPLYLVHWPICGFGLAILSEGSRGALPAYIAVLVSIGLSVIINHFLVYPVDRWRQSRARSSIGVDSDGQRRQDASIPV